MMHLASKSIIKGLLKKHNARPLKKFGQHFLIDRNVLQKIIKAADVQKNDVILEIGPGIGTLTQELAKRAKKVIAVEKDWKMVEILEEALKDFQNVEVIQRDILTLPLPPFNPPSPAGRGETRRESPPSLVGRSEEGWGVRYKLVANLPYYIAAPVIRKFLEAENPPEKMVLMAQKEVGQRICASPSQVFVSQKLGRARPPKMNLLAVAVQFYAKPEIVSYVSRKSFWPEPKVDSAIIKIVSKQIQKEPLSEIPATAGISDRPTIKLKKLNELNGLKEFGKLFFRIVKAGFSHPRKQLINNLSTALKIDKEKVLTWLQKNNIRPEQRAQTMSVENWLSLTQTYGIMDDG